jgi:3-oxoacyl-(acyl-carrier-protein) synthase
MALRHGFLPPTLNLEPQDRELGELDLVPVGRASGFRYAMSNSFGFGGSNVSLVFEKGGCDGES